MIDPDIDDTVNGNPLIEDEENSEETKEPSLFDVGPDKTFNLTADLTNRKLWVLNGDVVPNDAGRTIVWSTDPTVMAKNITQPSEVDKAIPEEREWLKDPSSKVWSRIDYLRDESINDHEHQLSKDARTFLAYDQSIQSLHHNLKYILRHSTEGNLAIKRCFRDLLDEVINHEMLGVIDDALQVRNAAFDVVTNVFLKGVMDFSLDSERLMTLSGRLTLVQGAVRDYVSNHNHILNASQGHSTKENLMIFRRIREAIRHKIPFHPLPIDLPTDRPLLLSTVPTALDERWCTRYQRHEDDFLDGLRGDTIPVQFIFELIPSAITAVAFFDHYHQYYHLHRQHHHFQQQQPLGGSPGRSKHGATTRQVPKEPVLPDIAPPEETILIAGHANGTVSLWRLSFRYRHRPPPPIFLGCSSPSPSPATDATTSSSSLLAIRDIQLHPLDPFSILVTQTNGDVTWHRLRLSIFDYHYGSAANAAGGQPSSTTSSPEASPQKRNQQLVVSNRRSGGLFSLLWQCFRRSPRTTNPAAANNRALLTLPRNSNGEEIQEKQWSVMRKIVSIDAADLPYDPPPLSELRYRQEETRRRDIFLRYAKEISRRRHSGSGGAGGGSWWRTRPAAAGSDTTATAAAAVDRETDDHFAAELAQCLVYPYSRADYHPRPTVACFHPAINRMTSATALLVAATSGDVYKFNVDRVLAELTTAVAKEDRRRWKDEAAALAATAAWSSSFKQFGDGSSAAARRLSPSKAAQWQQQQWRLVPPYDRSAVHVREEFVLPSQAPAGFLLKKPTTAIAATTAAATATPQVFRELLHFHHATHRVERTPLAQAMQFFARYPAYRAQALPSSSSSEGEAAAAEAAEEAVFQTRYLREQHRVLLVAPLTSSVFDPFHSPATTAGAGAGAAVDGDDAWHRDSVVTVDAAGYIAVWRTHEEAGYQHCQWHVPRRAVRLQSLLLLPSTTATETADEADASTLETFDAFRPPPPPSPSPTVDDTADAAAAAVEKTSLFRLDDATGPAAAAVSRWRRFRSDRQLSLRVQSRETFRLDSARDTDGDGDGGSLSDDDRSRRDVQRLLRAAWAQRPTPPSTQATAAAAATAAACPAQWRHTTYAPVALSTPPPVPRDLRGAVEAAVRAYRHQNNDDVAWWQFHRYDAAVPTATTAAKAKATRRATVWCAQLVRRVAWSFLVVQAQVTPDRTRLFLLLHCHRPASSSTAAVSTAAAAAVEHWRIVSVSLRDLSLSPVHIVVHPPPPLSPPSASASQGPPYVRDFAVSTPLRELGGRTRLVAVLVASASTPLRFFSTLRGAERRLDVVVASPPAATAAATAAAKGNAKAAAATAAAEGSPWQRVQWCASWRYLALYAGPRSSHSGGGGGVLQGPAMHHAAFYFHRDGLGLDEESATAKQLDATLLRGEPLPLPLLPSASVGGATATTTAATFQLLRLRHTFDRDAVAVAQWQQSPQPLAHDSDDDDDGDGDGDGDSDADGDGGGGVAEAAAASAVAAGDGGVALPFLLRPRATDDDDDDASDIDVAADAARHAASGKYLARHGGDLWHDALQRAVATWLDEVVDDAVAIATLRRRAAEGGQLLRHWFATGDAGQAPPLLDDEDAATPTTATFGAVAPSQWPDPTRVEAAVEAILRRRRAQYEDRPDDTAAAAVAATHPRHAAVEASADEVVAFAADDGGDGDGDEAPAAIAALD